MSAHVVEIFNVYVSNSSISQYNQDRQAFNLTISNWQQVLNTNLLVEHILNPKLSISNLTFLPGPVNYNENNGGIAKLELNYYVKNVTTVKEISPRVFEYSFNDSVFNFIHTASGESLPSNARLNIILPPQTNIISVYPFPDYPSLSFAGNYSGATSLSWFSAEPLSKFSLIYTIQQSLEDEVLNYFSMLYNMYGIEITIIIIIIISIYLFFYLRRIRKVV
jgi:hypothetical protein